MARYKRPRRINPVSLVLILAGLAAVYAGFQFGPPYWRKFKVTGVIKDAASQAILHPELSRLQRETENRIRDVGVNATTIRVTFNRGGGQVEVVAEYVEIVRHPLVNKVTQLPFRPTVKIEDSRIR